MDNSTWMLGKWQLFSMLSTALPARKQAGYRADAISAGVAGA